MAILQAWLRARDDLCPQCGQPLDGHEAEDPATIHTGYRTCPRTAALDRAQAARFKTAEDERARKDGLNPERARTWLAWSDAEGPPRY